MIFFLPYTVRGGILISYHLPIATAGSKCVRPHQYQPHVSAVLMGLPEERIESPWLVKHEGKHSLLFFYILFWNRAGPEVDWDRGASEQSGLCVRLI